MLWSTVPNAARRVTCLQLIFMKCHSVPSVALFLCSDPFGKRIVRLDKGRIDSYDCEFGRKQHALSVLI